MADNFDVVFSAARVIDGLGNPAVTADIAVKDGRIAEIGRISAPARETVDADGLVLAPGFIDTHTHYDAQITWDPYATPSLGLGATTVVMGNCGFGIAPCRAGDRDTAARNLAVVEGMDIETLRAGIRWEFETFPEYLDALRRSGLFVNVAAFVGHSPVRLTVMGEDSSKRAATDEEIGRMREIIRAAVMAGAVGFSSSYSDNHEGYGGVPMPSRLADEDELSALVGVLGEVGRGVYMMTTGGRYEDPTPLMERLARESGRPMILSALFQIDSQPGRTWRYLDRSSELRPEGVEMYGQVSNLPVSMDFSLEYAYPFYSMSAWDEIRGADRARLKAAFADTGFRKRFRDCAAKPELQMIFQGDWKRIEIVGATPANAGLEGRTIAEIAAQSGRDPVDVLFDIGLDEDLATTFVANLVNVDEDEVSGYLTHENSLISLSDAGAHLTFMCNAGYGLDLLGRWVRDRGRMDLIEAVRCLTSKPADAYRIADRGRILPGAHADLILFDPARVGVTKKRRVADLPKGGSRLTCDAVGLAGVWVNGAHVFDGENYMAGTARPGRVIDRYGA